MRQALHSMVTFKPALNGNHERCTYCFEEFMAIQKKRTNGEQVNGDRWVKKDSLGGTDACVFTAEVTLQRR